MSLTCGIHPTFFICDKTPHGRKNQKPQGILFELKKHTPPGALLSALVSCTLEIPRPREHQSQFAFSFC